MDFDQTRFNTVKKGFSVSTEYLPIGGGDCGANVWVSDDGKVDLLLSKTDSFSEAARLMKLGLLRIGFDRPVFTGENLPSAELDLSDGTVRITDAAGSICITVAAFIDKALYGIRVRSQEPLSVHASVFNYRSRKKQIDRRDSSARGVADGPFDVFESADKVVTGRSGCLSWYHYNEWSYYDYSIRNQHLTGLKRPDPVRGRIFGCSVAGKGFSMSGDELCSVQASDHIFYISADCSMTDDPQGWNLKQMTGLENSIGDYCFDCLLAENRTWWTGYFNRYYLEMAGDERAETITRVYTLQKYVLGCACRGKMPVRFNGSIFTAQSSPFFEDTDYDYRTWGSAYWIQNSRLIYWDCLYSGNFDGIIPFFDLVTDLIPVDRERCRVLFGHDGLLQPETFTFYGTYSDCDFGYGQEDSPAPECTSGYIRWHYNGGLEISYMMLKFREFTGDRYADYFENKLLPYIQGILMFFKEHFPVQDGKMLLKPSAALETWQNCINDTPDVAGLLAVVRELKRIGITPCIDEADIPGIPTEIKDGVQVIAPCSGYVQDHTCNYENPELYTLFPFELFRYDMNDADRELVRNTFDHPTILHPGGGWSQRSIWAAMLGDRQFSPDTVAEDFLRKDPEFFFDTNFGPGFDYTPDQDNGSQASIAAIFLILQSYHDDVFIRPAVPENWKVRFRLPSSRGDVEYSD